MKYFVKNIQDLERLRNRYLIETNLFTEILIDKSKLKSAGVFRWALKYSLWNLQVNGTIKIVDSSYKFMSQKNVKNDFWQTKKETFKCLKGDIECISLLNKEIVIKKICDKNYLNDGVTLGIVFSGDLAEENMLFKCIDKISLSLSNVFSYEILISGPDNYDHRRIDSHYPNLNIRYVTFNKAIENGRFLISKKKKTYCLKKLFLIL